jgi:hypothetical protein
MKNSKLVKKLENFFEEEGFKVHLFEQDKKQCAEVEKWTDGGVDMVIVLNPFSKDEFISWVNDFDVDEQIDIHREDRLYKNNFTISQSLKDFTDFHNHLKEVVEKINLL